ncbi:hypothetical protein C8J56DRAFT_1042167 [Mycena floridula]|nr:hypothetical protein C8J56DRAFT_1042167 [Mycena floridula]
MLVRRSYSVTLKSLTSGPIWWMKKCFWRPMLAKDPSFTGSLAAGKRRQVLVFVPLPLPPVTEPMADDDSDRLTDADLSGDDNDRLTDADASGDDDDEVLEWWVTLIDVATDNVK